ncbi:MAG: hypothetical protein HZA19_04430 [Nitrospirae bacterium]|nr:hypothetical protein [Nitrospirota bacterium]
MVIRAVTMTDKLTADFLAQKAHGVSWCQGWDFLEDRRSSAEISHREVLPWITFVLPIAKKESSCQVTEVSLQSEQTVFIPRTALGGKLLALRNRAIESGIKLFTEDEVLEEVRRRRGEIEDNETDVY